MTSKRYKVGKSWIHRPGGRRFFLKVCGASGASFALPSLVSLDEAQAQDGWPRRLVVFTTNHGPPAHHWRMNHAELPGNQDGSVPLSSFSEGEFSRVLEPLHEVRNRINVIDALAQATSMIAPTGNNHGQAWAELLTNQHGNYTNPFLPVTAPGGIHPYPTTESFDRYIARQVTPPGVIESLHWGNLGFWGQRVTYSSNESGWIPIESSPQNAFNRLVENGLGQDEEQSEPTRRDLIQQRRASVLDFVHEQYQALRPQLSREDARKLELHADEIRLLEQRFAAPPARLSCDSSFTPQGNFVDDFSRLIKIALACDMSRVISLNLGDPPPEDFGAPRGSDVHNGIAHSEREEDHVHMANFYRLHAGQFASLVKHLDEVPEGDGTLLDNTLVLWITELGNGQHDYSPCMVVTAGGSASGISQGRYLKYAQNRPRLCTHYGCEDGGIGPAMVHLYISAMHHMGLSDSSFNMKSGRALDGSTADFTGPLPLLKG